MSDGPGWDGKSAAESPTPDCDDRAFPPAVLELDHVYEALGHPRRRYLCYTLLEGTDGSLDDVATRIAAWENGVPERTVIDEWHKQVYVALYHVHVPKLVERGVVAFDEASETITPAENAPQVLAALEAMVESLDGTVHTSGVNDEAE